MKKPRSRIQDYLVYLVVRCIVCVLQACSPRVANSIAAGLAWLAYHVNKRHRQVALDNLRGAFPGRYSDADLDRVVRAVYRHFCTMLMEIMHLPRRMHVHNWPRYLQLPNARAIIHQILQDRPLLIVTGHFGNWEFAGYALGLLGFKTHAVARPLDNPYLDEYLRRFREGTGQKLLAKKGDFDQMEAILRDKGVIATLADQDAGPRGLFVDYFGKPASTHKAIALLALEHQVPLLVIGVPRLDGIYQVLAGEVILPEEYAGRGDAVRAITQRFTTALERLVRLAPEQYFWLHRRWKHQPKTKHHAA